jgi:tetratricopeptide (TPR) repeat protein
MKAPAILRILILALAGSGFLSPLPAQTAPPAGESVYLEAVKLETKGDLDGAIAKASDSLRQNPGELKTLVLRGDLYAKKRMWPEAQADFQTALKIDPENAYAKFDLAEIKLMQKQFADARPGFRDLVYDPNLGDLAAYKVFLCDLFGGNRDDAAQRLRAFDKIGGDPSYYYANAAWLLYNKKTDDARSWLDSAARIYSTEKNHTYLSTLEELGYLPLPAQ